MLKKLDLKTKLIGGFLFVALMVLIVGAIGGLGIRGIVAKNEVVARTSPLVDAAMEMKIAVVSDMAGIMEILASENEAALREVWAEHEDQIVLFDTFADGILKGAETDEGTIYAAESEDLKNIVRQADDYHNAEFQPRLQQLYTTKMDGYAAEAAVETAMLGVETASAAVVSNCEDLEVFLSDQLDTLLAAGTSTDELMAKYMLWIDLSMELKVTILVSQIAIEEFVQSWDVEQMNEVEREYQATLGEFDRFVTALLAGGKLDNQHVPPLTAAEAIAAVQNLDQFHENFQTAAAKLIKSQHVLAALAADESRLDKEADRIALQMVALMGKIEVAAKTEIATVQTSAQKQASAATTQSLIGMVVGLVLAIGLGFFLALSITRPINRTITSLQQGAEQVASASSQVAASSQQMAEGASEQASSLEETAASLEIMSSMARESAAKTDGANRESRDVMAQAEQGQAAMGNLDAAMVRIKTSSDETAKIIKTIDEIAFQTNLLALNAAVEAARAGDAGKGFAVVAEEVRNLAQRSSQAAKDTTTLIEESKGNSELGVKATSEMAEILNQVVAGIERISELVDGVAGNAEDQAKSIGEATNAVGQMDLVTQGNAASAEESASAAEEMSAQAAEMQTQVQSLVGIVSGSGAGNTTSGKTFESPAITPKAAPQPTRPRSMGAGPLDGSPMEVIPLDDDCLIDV